MDSTSESQEAEGGRRGTARRGIAWVLVALASGYAIFAYYGLGPPPGGLPTTWWHPRTFMLDWPVVGGWVDDPLLGAAAIATPAALLCAGIFFCTRSAIARALGLSFIFVAALFAGAGFAAGQAWELFTWRLSTVLFLSGLALGFTVASPLLARSFVRLPQWLQILVYFPLFFAVVAAVRGATGTSERLMFYVSPWPMLTAFGLEIGVVLVTGVLFSIALGVLCLSKKGPRGTLPYIGLAIAALLPAVWISRMFGALELAPVLVISVASVILIGVSQLTFGADHYARLRERGFYVALGASLAFLPIFMGTALGKADYAVNRHLRAPAVIAALDEHIKKEDHYPDKLEELVERGYLDEEPIPRIGFAFLGPLGLSDKVKYRYNEYGSSFVLEFDSRLWVQCAYSGNYYYGDEDEEVEVEIYGRAAEDAEDEEPEAWEIKADGGESWSCLGKQPNLFGDDTAGEEEEEDDYATDDS